MTTLFNLTPHAIHIYDDDGKTLLMPAIPSHGELRLKSEPQRDTPPLEVGNGVSIRVVERQRFVGLDPASRGYAVFDAQKHTKGAAFIVSAVLAEWLVAQPFELTVLAPSTGPTYVVRDDEGRTVGTKRLERFFPWRRD